MPEEQGIGSFADAWLLDLGGDRFAAVALQELQEVLVAPPLTLPAAATIYCRYTVSWRGLTLPVMDLAVVFGAPIDETPPRWLTVAAYREAPDLRPGFGALQLAAPPTAIRVTDEMACPIPETSLPEYLAWSYLALCCFRYQGRVIPILDLPLLFSQQAQQRLQRYSTPSASTGVERSRRRMEEPA